MEPIATGALAAALALGAKVDDTTTVKIVKDAYNALKENHKLGLT
jgi:hypothetical protein